MTKLQYGARLKGIREAQNLTQENLAKSFGFKDRQTVSAIESGERKLSAEELIKATQIFNVPLDYFSNPFLIVGESRFSWRQSGVSENQLIRFEEKAGEWIGSFRELSRRVGEEFPATLPRIGLSEKSSFEASSEAGERIGEKLELGDIPSKNLAEKTEEQLGTLVLMVDGIEGISGAACQIPELNVVLINRNEPVTRRNFDLAHEIFHLLTWDTMPPEHIDGSGIQPNQKRIEQLADNFAAGLLMPESKIELLGKPAKDICGWINESATYLGVSSIALKWRLVNTKRLGAETVDQIGDDLLRNNGLLESDRSEPPKFSKQFLKVIGRAASNGHISARRLGTLLEMNLDDIVDLYDAYELEPPFEL